MELDIVNVTFETSLKIKKGEDVIEIIPFITEELGVVKFGINAPRSLRVDREEIALQRKATIQK